ncbi:hypothetical protein [Asticcacaulis sp. EMRT-3]|uniref:hypothetical protein n=1 Tax=Asticcacaulis sp. EMRT-3 TaxID=3040349 RepID=UPI0024AF4B48|nr:hypothetical protein [Asticcacaulis sp. EMRT-3]MDI7774602.1 hypothetical protein [Asticcacaulis sp. EMRT-3]
MPLSFEFAFEGFRIIRERPKLIAFWGAVALLGNAVILLLMVGMAGPAFMSFYKLLGQHPDPVLAATLSEQIAPAFLACLPVYVVMSAILTCAICRVVLGETDSRFGFLSFGLRELVVAGVELIMLVIRSGVVMGCLLLGGIAAQILSGVSPEASSLCLILSMLAAVGLVLWMSLRLSLNVAHSFDTGRLDIFGSYSLTKDLFWPLFTGYATAFGLSLVVMFLCNMVIEAILVFGFGASAKGNVAVPDLSSLHAFLTIGNIAEIVLTYGILSPLIAAILMGAPVAAYKKIRTLRKTVTVSGTVGD